MGSSHGQFEIASDHPRTLILDSVRDIETCQRSFPNAHIRADLHGLITWRSKRSNNKYLFFRLHDGTGSIQVAAREPDLNATEIESIQPLDVYSRVNAKGHVGWMTNTRNNASQLTLFLDAPPSLLSYRLDPQTTFDTLEPQIANIGAQIYLARLRDRAVEFFRSHGYLELVTRYLSRSWGFPGVPTLQVTYSGYGLPVHLAPSPKSQLLKALVLTGKPQVFSIARCFTPAYRDNVVSAESPLLLAQCLDTSLPTLCQLAEDAVRFVFDDMSTKPQEPEYLQQKWERLDRQWPEQSTTSTSAVPEVHVFQMSHAPSTDSRLQSLFRVCWPPDLILAEGAIERLDGPALVGTCSLHFERMLAAIRPTVRQLQDLGFASPNEVG
jgi:hypothetical protein